MVLLILNKVELSSCTLYLDLELRVILILFLILNSDHGIEIETDLGS